AQRDGARGARPDRPRARGRRPGHGGAGVGGPAAADPLREPAVRPAGPEDPSGRGRDHRLRPHARAVWAGAAADTARADRARAAARPADPALGPVARAGSRGPLPASARWLTVAGNWPGRGDA